MFSPVNNGGSPPLLVNPPACYDELDESRKPLPTIEEEAVSHQETKLGGMEDPQAKEIKLSPSIHLPFQAFQPIDLAFDLSLAPGEGTRSIHGRVILLHALGETFEFGHLTAFGCFDPILQLIRFAFFEHAQEGLTKLIRCG
jgi:hypothetical protein